MQRMDIERVGTALKMLTPEGTSHHLGFFLHRIPGAC